MVADEVLGAVGVLLEEEAAGVSPFRA